MEKSFYRVRTTKDIVISYSKRELFFPHTCRENVLKAVSTSPSSMEMTEENNGNGIRVDIFYSQKEGAAYFQVLEYIPYKYDAVSPFYKYSLESVNRFIR